MGNIIPFLRERVFEPQDIQAMSLALDEVCAVLTLPVAVTTTVAKPSPSGSSHWPDGVSVAPSNCASGCFERQWARQFSFV